MTTNPTRLESGTRHVLAYCVECPSWRELATDRADANRRAAVHVDRVHGQWKLASTLRLAASRYSERHAQLTGNPPESE